jgi:phosphohistidine phosphatase
VAAQLWLLRHGEAEPHDARPDADRRLTERGEAQSRDAGRALAALGISFALVFTSPKVRARETAVLACKSLGVEPVVHPPLGDGLDVHEALALAAAGGEDARTLLVGHEPDLSQVLHDLTGARVQLKKGGLAGVALQRSIGGEMLALLRPRELRRLARAPSGKTPS